MKMSVSVIILIALGIVAAVAAAMLTATLSAGRFENGANAEALEVTILIASEDISMMTPIRKSDIVEKRVEPGNAPANHFTNPAQIIGKRITDDMFAGQAFTIASFPDEGTGAQLATKIPTGMRAVSIQISSYESLEGLLYPGATVDVLASFRVSGNRVDGNAISTTLLQNIQVLAVANKIIGDNSVVAKQSSELKNRVARQPTVTLLVTAKQAEALQLAMKFGQISLTLRNPSDQEPVDDAATLLSEGVMAKLATLLGTSVTGEVFKKEEDPEPPVEDEVEEEPEPIKQPVIETRILKVKIYNGLNKSEESKAESID